MLTLHKMRGTLAEKLRGPDVTAEVKLWAEHCLRPLIFLQEHPDLAVHVGSGIESTPTQRWMLYQAHRGAGTNFNVSSRGTAKTATWCVLYASYKGAHFPNRGIVHVNATGFRGSQLIYEDIDRWLKGGWADQNPEVDFFRAAVAKGKRGQSQQATEGKSYLHKAQNYWRLNWRSFSDMTALPTNDPERLRGVRATDVFLDEANTFDGLTISKVIQPWLNVIRDFKHGGRKAEKNAMYYTTTIDYQWREFQERLKGARDNMLREWRVYLARRAGEWERARELEAGGLHDYTLVQFDYTDTMVRTEVTTRAGRTYRVNYPNPDMEPELRERGVPFTTRNKDGYIQRDGPAVEVYRTFPSNVDEIEKGLYDGSTDETIWLYEQRNVTDTATGDVFPHWLLDKQSCKQEDQFVLAYKDCSADWQRVHAATKRDYCPTPQFRSTDPCVMAIDYAGGDRDFASFVVIRIGPAATGTFDPLTQLGKTTWSNVIWCEQHRLMSHRAVREKIYLLMDRYNIVWHFDAHQDDDWKLCRGIGLDMRGGGQGVRDALIYLDEPFPEGEVRRIYDPLDKDPRVQAYLTDKDALPALDAISAQDTTNDRCAEFLLAQMKVGNLYLPTWYEESDRPTRDAELVPAYNASKVLMHQLMKIQQKPTKTARTFYMPGSTENVEGKKDLFSSLMYCGKQLRAHLIRQQMIDSAPPPMGALVAKINMNRGNNGRAGGAKDTWRRGR
jgi:hypothetical protein